MKSKILLAHPGTQHSHQLASQLHLKGLLFEFHTGIAFGEDHWLYSLLRKIPGPFFNLLSKRFVPLIPDKFIKRKLWLELLTLLFIKSKFNSELILNIRNSIFQKIISSKSLKGSDAIIGFDTSSHILIKRAQKLRIPFILDVSIAHPIEKKHIYQDLIKRYPEWGFNVAIKNEKSLNREQFEMDHADFLVVASSFTYKTYIKHGINANKIIVNPYGVDCNYFTANIPKPIKDKINFVFVGLVDVRKGIPLLLNAWRKINKDHATLTLIGPIDDTTKEKIKQSDLEIKIKNKISLIELSQILPSFDVMVFPSFFEGFGLVVLEAMACGLPVITTNATCGSDVISNHIDGILINNNIEEELIESMSYFINNSDQIYKMGKLARKKAEDFNWNTYGERWNQSLREILSNFK